MDSRSVALNRRLLEALPSLRGGHAELIDPSDGREPGSHIVYGDLLAPLLRDELLRDGPSESLSAAFSLLEEILTSENEYAQEVVIVSVLNGIDSPELVRRARNVCGPLVSAALGDWEQWRK